MRPFRLQLVLLIAGAALAAPGAWAQDATVNDRLRDLLRQTIAELRAAQDNAASLQAQLDSATKQRDALQQQLAAAQAKPAAAPAAPDTGREQALQAAQTAARANAAQLAQAAVTLQRWQKAYQEAAVIAREKDAADRADKQGLRQVHAELDVCIAENTHLISTAEDILHLYETPQWNTLLIANHDRLIGLARVKLQNTVQDYEDKLDAQSYVAPRAH